MVCKKCSLQALKGEEYCKKHQEEEFLDLTTGGFFKWVYFFLKHYTPQKSPDFHRELVDLYFSLYNPHYINRYNRQLEEVSFRGSSKSTILTMFIPMFLLCNNNKEITIWADIPKEENGELKIVREKIKTMINESFIVVVSKTGNMAEDFVVRMRDELSSNRRLRFWYGAQIEDAMDAIDGQWTRRAFKFNKCHILGVGSGQQIRGRIKGAYRPTTIIFDDIYDEENITDSQRAKIKSWFYAGAMNSLDDLRGKALLAGTIIHEDTVLVECENSSSWKTVKFYPMPIEEFYELLKYLKVDEDHRECRMPFDEESNEVMRAYKQADYFKDLQGKKDWKLAWDERVSLYYMAIKFKDAVQTGAVQQFYQEYFHITIPESAKRFKRDYFQQVKGEWKVFQEFGYNWFECKELYEEPQIVNIEFGLDIAGVSDYADNTAIMSVGALPDNRMIVFPAVYGKMNTRDVLREDSSYLFRYDKVLMDKQHLLKAGFMDETFRLFLQYHPHSIKIGVAGQENRFPEDMRLLFQANNIYCNVNPRPQNISKGSKHERIRNGLLKRYETLSMFHCKGNDLLERELEFLTKFTTDDLADALEVACHNVQFPVRVSYKDFAEPHKVRRKPFNKYIVSDSEFDWRTS